MKTLMIILVAAAILVFLGYLVIPGSPSRVAAAVEQTGKAVDNASSDEHLEGRVLEAKRKDWEDLQKGYGVVVDIENDIEKNQEGIKLLEAEKAKEMKYLEKETELLAKYPSQELILVAGQKFNRKEVEKNMQGRYGKCTEIDQKISQSKKLIEKQQAALADLRQKYEFAKEGILADLTLAEKMSDGLARLRLEEEMYQRLKEYNGNEAFRSRTESSRAMQSFRERFAQVQKSVRISQEASSLLPVSQEENQLQNALEQEFSGDVMAEIKDYLGQDDNSKVGGCSSGKSLEKALEGAELN
ncbi:MAG: hypothetical protein Q8N58_02490 [bacterium]|nr:hypothetical protein [bacterium]